MAVPPPPWPPARVRHHVPRVIHRSNTENSGATNTGNKRTQQHRQTLQNHPINQSRLQTFHDQSRPFSDGIGGGRPNPRFTAPAIFERSDFSRGLGPSGGLRRTPLTGQARVPPGGALAGPSFTPSSAASVFSSRLANASVTKPLPSRHRTEPAVIIWKEEDYGEVLSPTVWHEPRVHLFFDAETVIEDQRVVEEGGAKALSVHSHMDVVFSLPINLDSELASSPDTHVFVHVRKISDARIATTTASEAAKEMFLVIAKRNNGLLFLLSSHGERVVLHPHAAQLPWVRHVIEARYKGAATVPTDLESRNQTRLLSEMSLVGRTVLCGTSPAPVWIAGAAAKTAEDGVRVATSDKACRRWTILPRLPGPNVHGRGIVVHVTLHYVTLEALDGDVVRISGSRARIHCPTILFEAAQRAELVMDSVWHFVACAELPGRSCKWRAFQLRKPADGEDLPLSNMLIDVTSAEEENERSAFSVTSTSSFNSLHLMELSELGLDSYFKELPPFQARHPLQTTAAPLPESDWGDSEPVRVYTSNDAELDEDSAADVPSFFARMPRSRESFLVGASPEEAAQPIPPTARCCHPVSQVVDGQFRFSDDPLDIRVKTAAEKAREEQAVQIKAQMEIELAEIKKRREAMDRLVTEAMEKEEEDNAALNEGFCSSLRKKSVPTEAEKREAEERARERVRREKLEKQRKEKAAEASNLLQNTDVLHVGVDEDFDIFGPADSRAEQPSVAPEDDESSEEEVDGEVGATLSPGNASPANFSWEDMPTKPKLDGGWWFRATRSPPPWIVKSTIPILRTGPSEKHSTPLDKAYCTTTSGLSKAPSVSSSRLTRTTSYPSSGVSGSLSVPSTDPSNNPPPPSAISHSTHNNQNTTLTGLTTQTTIIPRPPVSLLRSSESSGSSTLAHTNQNATLSKEQMSPSVSPSPLLNNTSTVKISAPPARRASSYRSAFTPVPRPQQQQQSSTIRNATAISNVQERTPLAVTQSTTNQSHPEQATTDNRIDLLDELCPEATAQRTTMSSLSVDDVMTMQDLLVDLSPTLEPTPLSLVSPACVAVSSSLPANAPIHDDLRGLF